MRAVVQRVSSASVVVDSETVGRIDAGVLILLAVSPDDGETEVAWLADKVVNLRIFEDEEGKMNRSLQDAGGAVLLVSQFTLYGDARRGRRPSFIRAARGEEAEALYESTARAITALGVTCEKGVFGADMKVSLVNDGPITILLDSEKTF